MELSDKAFEQVKSLLDKIIANDDKTNPELSTEYREAYKALTGEPYINKRETLFRVSEIDIKRDHIIVSPVMAQTGEVWIHLPTGRDFIAEDHHNRTLFRPVDEQPIHAGDFRGGDKFNYKGLEGEVSKQNQAAVREVDPAHTFERKKPVNDTNERKNKPDEKTPNTDVTPSPKPVAKTAPKKTVKNVAPVKSKANTKVTVKKSAKKARRK